MRSVFLVLILFIKVNLLAQTIQEDRILLNNGSSFKGKIIDSTDTAIRIECYDLNIYAISKNEIKERTKGPANLNYKLIFDSILVAEKANDNPYFNKGFKINAALNYGINITDKINTMNSKTLTLNLGYRLNKSLLFGLQTGVHTIANNKKGLLRPNEDELIEENISDAEKTKGFAGRISVPLCLNIEQTLFVGNFSSLLSFNLGYDINLTKKYLITNELTNGSVVYGTLLEGIQWGIGFIFNPELKLMKKLNSKINLFTSFGYMRNQVSFKYKSLFNWFWNSSVTALDLSSEPKKYVVYGFVYIKAGIAF